MARLRGRGASAGTRVGGRQLELQGRAAGECTSVPCVPLCVCVCVCVCLHLSLTTYPLTPHYLTVAERPSAYLVVSSLQRARVAGRDSLHPRAQQQRKG